MHNIALLPTCSAIMLIAGIGILVAGIVMTITPLLVGGIVCILAGSALAFAGSTSRL